MRRVLLYTFAVAALVSIAAAQSTTVRIDGQQLHLLATRIHFLTGEALLRLRDGATVNYELQLTARPDRAGKLLGRAVEHFSVSYDLWEEKFAVTKLGGLPKAVSHLSAAAADRSSRRSRVIVFAGLSVANSSMASSSPNPTSQQVTFRP